MPVRYDVPPDAVSPGEVCLMLTMYSTQWCGYCHRLRAQLDREGIGYRVVDIERDESAAAFVESVNRGNQTVPTVRFMDGSTLTNPTIVQVKARISTLSS
jgi:mycoredoxin